ncbi:hypothetical protein ACFO0N_07550 [Halobium salinum]|uniref:PGF-CTERM sorting domain-containing protein n=1 Tax=Halobium salinum TaxID=1364940 RepID=A0ABD5PBG1_9EURY|nr:hypothetical protein [Halobium salinum]
MTAENTDVVRHSRQFDLAVGGRTLASTRVSADAGEERTFVLSGVVETTGEQTLAVGAQRRTIVVRSPSATSTAATATDAASSGTPSSATATTENGTDVAAQAEEESAVETAQGSIQQSVPTLGLGLLVLFGLVAAATFLFDRR